MSALVKKLNRRKFLAGGLRAGVFAAVAQPAASFIVDLTDDTYDSPVADGPALMDELADNPELQIFAQKYALPSAQQARQLYEDKEKALPIYASLAAVESSAAMSTAYGYLNHTPKEWKSNAALGFACTEFGLNFNTLTAGLVDNAANFSLLDTNNLIHKYGLDQNHAEIFIDDYKDAIDNYGATGAAMSALIPSCFYSFEKF